MSTITLTLPDGRSLEQPRGLFIDNKYVQGNGELIDVLDPV